MMKTLSPLILLLFVCSMLTAQQPVIPIKRTVCGSCIRRLIKKQAPPEPVEFFVGEARVDVTKDETVVKLAMAQHGSVLIELPANDGPRYILPGDPEMATVDEKALERNKRAIVVRPGSRFLPPLRNAKSPSPTATVTAQMRSGLVVTFLFYPVGDLAQNVHRCVLHYNRDDVVARRRAAGLPVNLDGTSQGGEVTAQPAAPKSISVEEDQNPKPTKAPVLPNPQPSSNWILDKLPIRYLPEPAFTKEQRVTTSTREALNEAVKTPTAFSKWTKPVNGLSLSLKSPQVSSGEFAIVVVAIRNPTSDDLTVSDHSLEILTELIDRNQKPIDIRSVKPLCIEASDQQGSLRPGKTIYYAIAYPPLTLNVHQRLRLQISHTKAIDEPATIIITGNEEGAAK